jgi:hypothetical protein
MVCSSHNDTIPNHKQQVTTVVDLTHQHTNRAVLVEGPEITIRSVGTRRVTRGLR